MDSSITKWLSGRPKWLQVAAKEVIRHVELNDDLIDEFVALCLKETNNEFPDIDYTIPSCSFDIHDSEEIRLCAISEIEGVNKLAPKKPLGFGNSNIAVIYGKNGSGKSGYVRLLKHVCRTRDCIRGPLHKNVFSTESTNQKAKISFLQNKLEKEYKWDGRVSCKALSSVDIFDTSFDKVFIGNEDEISYEPPILSFISSLIDICDKVAAKIEIKSEALQSKMPHFPEHLAETDEFAWVKKLCANTSNEEIENYCVFTSDNDKELISIQKRISEQAPASKAKQLRNKKDHADNLVNEIQAYLNQFSNENSRNIIASRINAINKKTSAEIAAKKAFSGAKLDGVGSETWRDLWNVAKHYSEEMAYLGQVFPVLKEDSVCVLCQQPLSKEAIQRFKTFESYIKGETQSQADKASNDVKKLMDSLPDIPSLAEIKIDAAGIESQEVISTINSIIDTLQDRKVKLLSVNSENELPSYNHTLDWIKEIKKISQNYEDTAKKYDVDAAKDNHAELEGKQKNLQARKWLFQQKGAIIEEVNRLKLLSKYQKTKKTTNSKTLSAKKSELADRLITDAFIERFNKELKLLGANHLRVKMIKSKVKKGKVLHTLKLDGAICNINEIISEGEKRIISIATFFADIIGKNYPAPIVFDDPISSLDQDYEEAVVQRLCSIASERQVIIFTHRLSLLVMVQDYAKKRKIEPEIICIRDEMWGTGEPGDMPINAKKPFKALKKLINDELPKAKNIIKEFGREDYEKFAKGLCSDFRILIERTIELELLADVVQRYRRSINTKGKIENLSRISEEDCIFFDDLMTKYSRYEHSQPVETPISPPEPTELETDFNNLKEWFSNFNNRCCV